MVMKNPPHPGLSIKENCLEPLGLNITEAAKGVGCSPSYAFSRTEWSCGYFSGDGYSA